MLRASRRWLFRLGALGVSAMVALVLTEVLIRVAGVDRPRLWEPDSELGWRHVPGAHTRWTEEGDASVRINSHGFRDVERRIDKSPGVFRIVVLGDSTTEGIQVDVEDTFTRQLEKRLSRGGHSVEVFNFGVNGYSPVQELLLFKQEGPRYRPDLAIMSVFLDNDVADCDPALSDHEAPFMAVGDPGEIDYSKARLSYEQYHREPVYSIRRYSALYRLLSYVRLRWLERRNEAAHGHGGIARRFMLYRKPVQDEWEKGWSVLEHVLLEFIAEARRQDVKPLILSVPAGQVVNADAWSRILRNHPNMATEMWDLNGPEERLKSFATAHDIPLVQPYATFAETGAAGQLFFGDVGHMTAKGHAIVAGALGTFLETTGRLPRPRLAARETAP